eukprot:Awhi_evm1s15706
MKFSSSVVFVALVVLAVTAEEEASQCSSKFAMEFQNEWSSCTNGDFNMTESLKLGLEDRVRYYESLGNFTEQKLNCQSFKNVTSVDSDNFKKTIGLSKNATLAFPKNFYQCAKAGLRFQAGNNCLRCQPDSDMFINDDVTSAVRLHNYSCTSIGEKCGPLFMNLNHY